MRYTLLYLLTLVLFGCGNRNSRETARGDIIRDTVVMRETIPVLDSAFHNSGMVYVKYRQPINGYYVEAFWLPLVWRDELGHGSALLRFRNEKESFTVVHEHYSPSESYTGKARNGLPIEQSVTVDYREGEYEYHNVFKGYAPFFFTDVNFDGQRDLVLNYRRQGQRTTNAYRVHLRKDGKIDNDLLYRQTDDLPYSRFDDMTEFDFGKKEIVISSSGGAYSWSKDYYRLNESGDFEHYKTMAQDGDTIYEYRPQPPKEVSKRIVND